LLLFWREIALHRLSHYRSISLCSTIYKVILKILVNRLRSILDSLVFHFQSVFIPDKFHPTLNSWIKECNSSLSYSIIINKEPNGLFTPSRRIKQVDLVSPFISILCREALNHMLSKFHAYFLRMIAFFFTRLIQKVMINLKVSWAFFVQYLHN